MLVHVHRVSWGGFGGCKVNNISDMSKNEQKRVILARSARLTTTYSLATLLRLFRQVTSSARALLGCTPIHSQLSYIHIATQLIQIESAYSQGALIRFQGWAGRCYKFLIGLPFMEGGLSFMEMFDQTLRNCK